jgi:hypothetical protein
MAKIWVNEQLDPSGLLYACIACCNEQQAIDCRNSFESNLTNQQKSAGWSVRMSIVSSWRDVPAGALESL